MFKRASNMNRVIAIIAAAGLVITVAGCGYTPGQRALSGGLIGAGGGAGLAAVTGGSPLAGALIGGGAGALTGALTAPPRRHW
jgi:hypothetical protein